MSEVQFRRADEQSGELDEIVHLHEMLRAATAEYIEQHADPRMAMSLLMSVLPSYAGTLFATLLVMGEVRQQDQARLIKSLGLNFRSGLKVGLRRAGRIVASGEAGSVQ